MKERGLRLQTKFSLIVLILANLWILIFSFIYGKSVLYNLVLAFIIESYIIIFYACIKIAVSKIKNKGKKDEKIINIIRVIIGSCIFLYIPLIFILFLMSGLPEDASTHQNIINAVISQKIHVQIFIIAASFLISHGFSFFINFIGKKEYERKTSNDILAESCIRAFLMLIPFLLWIAIGFIGMIINLWELFSFIGMSIFVYFIFFLKLTSDILRHLIEHSN